MKRITGSLERASFKYPNIDLSKVKLIGWGAGNTFRDYFPFTKLNLAYTVCPYTENQGSLIHGVEVKSPDSLLTEDLENCLIVVFSAHIGPIAEHISTLGKFRFFNAIGHSDIESDLHYLNYFDKNIFNKKVALSQDSNIKNGPYTFGIFCQGPITSETPLCLAFNRWRYPDVYICYVTANDQPRDLIDLCRNYVDVLIEYEKPENFSRHNRNAQIRSAKIGVKHLSDLKIPYSLRLRSCDIVFGSFLDALALLDHKHSDSIAITHGIKHVPFLLTDQFMFSRTENLVRFWECSEDQRLPNHPDFTSLTLDDHFLKFQNFAPECYLWKNYAHQLKFDNVNLVDSYKFTKERILLLGSTLGAISLKYLPMFTIRTDPGIWIDQKFWDDLHLSTYQKLLDAEEISNSPYTLKEWWSGRVM